MLCNSEAQIWCVDTWAYAKCTMAQYHQFLINIQVYEARVTVMQMLSSVAAVVLADEAPFDMAFIDGSHEYETVHADIILYSNLLCPGGLLSGHDYGQIWPGVRAAVDELLPDAHIREVGSIWWTYVE